MSGSKTVQMTSEELRALIARGESRSRPLPEGWEPEVSDPENPDAAAAIRAVSRQPESPRADAPQVHAGPWLDADIVKAFQAGGGNWQTRINDVLRDWLKSHPV